MSAYSSDFSLDTTLAQTSTSPTFTSQQTKRTLTPGVITKKPITGIIIDPLAYEFIGIFWGLLVVIYIIIVIVRRYIIKAGTRKDPPVEQESRDKSEIYEIPKTTYRDQVYELQDV